MMGNRAYDSARMGARAGAAAQNTDWHITRLFMLFLSFALLFVFAFFVTMSPALSGMLPSHADSKGDTVTFLSHDRFVPSSAHIYPSYPADIYCGLESARG